MTISRLEAARPLILGYDTAQAADGEIGFEIWQRLDPKPQLIVLDLMMPGMDGFAFLQKIREESEVPVILLTARSELSDKTKCLSAGADDYLVKPFALEELAARIAAVLRRTSVRASAAAGAPRAEEFVNGPLILVPEKRECRWEAARLLLALVKHPGAVIAHDALIREVWGAEHLGELSLLRVAFARIRRKLSEAGADGSVISSYSGVGYVITDLSESFD